MGNETITPEQTDFNALLFPGRKMLYVKEVAERLGADEDDVRSLIEEGKLHAVDVGGGGRKFWRIPVTSFERFLKQRSSLAAESPKSMAASQEAKMNFGPERT